MTERPHVVKGLHKYELGYSIIEIEAQPQQRSVRRRVGICSMKIMMPGHKDTRKKPSSETSLVTVKK